MYIDNIKIEYTKEYTFDKVGEHKVKFSIIAEINMDHIFKDIKDLISVEFILNEKKDEILSMASTFENCENFKNLIIYGFTMTNIKSTDKIFYNSGLREINFDIFDVSGISDLSYMFASSPLESLIINKFISNNAVNMSYMFYNCTSLTKLIIYEINTNKVTYMSNMFKDCHSLKSINLSSFNTESVTDMSNMFDGCHSLVSLDLKNYNTNKVNNMSGMFKYCNSLNFKKFFSFYSII